MKSYFHWDQLYRKENSRQQLGFLSARWKMSTFYKKYNNDSHETNLIAITSEIKYQFIKQEFSIDVFLRISVLFCVLWITSLSAYVTCTDMFQPSADWFSHRNSVQTNFSPFKQTVKTGKGATVCRTVTNGFSSPCIKPLCPQVV